MKKISNSAMTLAAAATFSALMALPAMAQAPLGLSAGGGGPNLSGDGMSAPSAGIPELSLPEADASKQESEDVPPNRFDGGFTVRQETRGEAFEPSKGSLAEARNPSFFERHTLADDHASIRTCLAAGEVCRAEFDVIMPTSDESIYDPAILINDEPVLFSGSAI